MFRSPSARVSVILLAAISLHGVRRLAAPLGEPRASFVGYAYLFVAVVVLVRLLGADPLVRVDAVPGRQLLVGVVSGVGLFVVVAVGYAAVQALGGVERTTAFRPAGAVEWALVLGTLLATVASEEVAFRGLVLDSLRDVVGDHGAVVGSAVLFSLYHLSAFQLVATFLLGVGLAGLVVRYGTLWPAMVAHAVVNGAGVALFALSTPGP